MLRMSQHDLVHLRVTMIDPFPLPDPSSPSMVGSLPMNPQST
jgi:hypothetical protein